MRETPRGRAAPQISDSPIPGGIAAGGFPRTLSVSGQKTSPNANHTEPVLRTPIRKSGRHSVSLAAGETRSYDFAFVPEPVPLTHEADLKADACECSTMV
jgi:hypothetical protein